MIVVIGGIYTGIFTPTEAAAMSAVYAFFVAVFVYKDMTIAKVPKILLDSANMSAMLLYIITNAVMFSYLMTSEQIPQELAAWMLDKGLGVVAFLLFVNIVLLLAGNVMEPSSIVLIMAPILFPVAMKLGIDPVHFGIMMVVNMEVGMCHPPVGLNLYVASGITKMGITELTIAVWPWLLTMLVFLVIVTYWPALTLVPAASPRHHQVGRRQRRPRVPASLAPPGRGSPPVQDGRHGGASRAASSRPDACSARGTGRPATKWAKHGIILNLFAFIQSESLAWPSNAPFPSSSPMPWPRISSVKSIRASRPADSRSSPRRCAGCRSPKPAVFTPFTGNGRFSRTWSIS